MHGQAPHQSNRVHPDPLSHRRPKFLYICHTLVHTIRSRLDSPSLPRTPFRDHLSFTLTNTCNDGDVSEGLLQRW